MCVCAVGSMCGRAFACTHLVNRDVFALQTADLGEDIIWQYLSLSDEVLDAELLGTRKNMKRRIVMEAHKDLHARIHYAIYVCRV